MASPRKVYVKTLGCKVNSFDSHALMNRFSSNGFELCEEPQDAHVTVVNTCSVTSNAEREARYLARRLRRDNPQALVVFTGCYAQTDSARLAAMDEIDFVVPNEVKDQLVDLVTARFADGDQFGRAPTDDKHSSSKLPLGTTAVADNRQSHFKSSLTFFDHCDSQQTRAFVKIQDGCDGFCTYCLIPYARGQSRSVPPELVLAEVRRLIASGTPELVITSIHVGDYGRDLPCYEGQEYPIVSLLADLLALPGFPKLRISSLEPREVSEPLVALLAAHRHLVADHFHLPLQSGDDRILKRMRRSYDARTYCQSVQRLRAAFPDACIGADVIPGFPGETDDEFAATCDLVRTLDLAYLHVFPYSKRPNTAAARLTDHCDGNVIKQRAAVLRELSDEQRQKYQRRFIGQSIDAIWENDVDRQGRRLGITANYLPLTAAGQLQPLAGGRGRVLIKGYTEDGRLLARPF